MKLIKYILVLLMTITCLRAENDLTAADKLFFKDIQKAVAGDQAERLATMVLYPLTVKIDTGNVVLKAPRDFVDMYKRIITAKVKQAVNDQQSDTLFKSWRGLMIGRGQIWFDLVKLEDESKDFAYKIIAINPLAPSQSPQ
ncbi:MAG: hypothetical protein JF599_05150 [Verrucomicrobia bacterium]|nr:hypothetical protein [Verrucomicrobiota bacterium]